MSQRLALNTRWVIVSVDKPVMMRRSDDETWILNPRRRYILNADALEDLSPHIDTLSDLQGSSLYRPLQAAPRVRLPGSHLLVERYRDRGIGDLLFTTGPLAYLYHATGNDLNVGLYAYAERGSVLNNCQYISHGGPLMGPIIYDADLPRYNFHWFIDTVTECNEEHDQLNVYDSMFLSLGIDPATVEPKFKRPFATLTQGEVKQLDDFFYWIFTNSKPPQDLRKTGYYVVAPFTNSSLRTSNYGVWLQVIEALSARRPVIIVGALRDRMPVSDMTPGDFVNTLESAPNFCRTGRVINMIGKTHIRNLMQLISKASCCVSMDSATLYIAQAFRTPCVSLWGSHDPGVRIGYDKDYMDLAIWHQKVCSNSPCYAWQGFPASKCPAGEKQTICACLQYVSYKDVTNLVDAVENKNPRVFVAASTKPATVQPKKDS
jgi:hypothetical protein